MDTIEEVLPGSSKAGAS